MVDLVYHGLSWQWLNEGQRGRGHKESQVLQIKGSNKAVGQHKSRQCNQSLAVPATEQECCCALHWLQWQRGLLSLLAKQNNVK